ncbi:MAG: hypothetical protein LBV50_01825 [Novosphingobium sp.]|jgi:hypothetical protein|nr:hypothetical protein [Novosphingobium sp.]
MPGEQIARAASTPDAARDWQGLRADGDIQFAPMAPLKPSAPPELPAWFRHFLEWLDALLKKLFSPVGEALGVSWPVIEKVLIGLAVVIALLLLWSFLVRPLLDARWQRKAVDEPEWAPDRDAAVALLDDADRLAAEGRYGEATHLLLQRSVHHIAEARADWLQPASTAREIAVLPMLPDRARRAFAVIAERVERSLFALRELDPADWHTARAAYADFALERFQRADPA